MKKKKDAVTEERTGPIATAYEVVSVIVSAAIIILIVFMFIFRLSGVVGDSMNPTLENGDWTFLGQTGSKYEPEYGDIVVVSQPNQLNEVIIKRVIATEGQTVDIDFQNGIVKVDGKELVEPYILEPTHMSFDREFPLTVPEGQVFVMGDNRNNSIDSRSSMIGCIDTDWILGRVDYAYGANGFEFFKG